MTTTRWDIKAIDRLSIAEDVLKEFSCCNINIISMKVTPGQILIKSWCRQLQDISYVQPRLSQRADIINVACLCEGMNELPTPEPKRPRYLSNIICSSRSMHALIEKAMKIADSKYTILIHGDTGAGKELLARAVHNSRQRRFYPFIPVNCSALPESLMENEFFDYEERALSSADCKGEKGLFEITGKSTLFLDEFGEMLLSLQAKLLHALQDGGIRRVGGAHIIPVNVHIIMTANANLEEMVEQRLLRADLYYRINVLSLTVPSLRGRPQDISLLIRHFMRECTKEFQRRIILDRTCSDAPYHHIRPGNACELENTIIRLMLMAESDVIAREESGMANLPATERDTTERPFKKQVLCVERQLTEQMVEDNASSRHIAKAPDVSHATVLNKVRDYQLRSMG